MEQIQIRSVSAPFDRPALGVRSVRVLGLAEAMGLLKLSSPMSHLDLDVLRSTLVNFLEAGIGIVPIAELAQNNSAEDLPRILDEIYESLEGSPNPDTEWLSISAVLGRELLLKLLDISNSSIERYIDQKRPTPDSIAVKLHTLARIIAHLSGAYNDIGIRRWFERPRSQLNGSSPADLLTGEWQDNPEIIESILGLAARINSSPAA